MIGNRMAASRIPTVGERFLRKGLAGGKANPAIFVPRPRAATREQGVAVNTHYKEEKTDVDHGRAS